MDGAEKEPGPAPEFEPLFRARAYRARWLRIGAWGFVGGAAVEVLALTEAIETPRGSLAWLIWGIVVVLAQFPAALGGVLLWHAFTLHRKIRKGERTLAALDKRGGTDERT